MHIDRCFAWFIMPLVVSARTYDNVIPMQGAGLVWFSELIWDDWNEEHIARQGVRMPEAMEAVRNAPALTGAREDTYRIIGQTDAERYLFVILAPHDHKA